MLSQVHLQINKLTARLDRNDNQHAEINSKLSQMESNYYKLFDRQDQLRDEFSDLYTKCTDSVNTINDNNQRFAEWYREAIRTTETFKKEYKQGFKRVLSFEADINEVKNKVKVINKKILDLKIINVDKPIRNATDKVLRNVGEKFTEIYGQVNEVVRSQSTLNSYIREGQDNLSEGFQTEIQDLRKQNNMLNQELERTQEHNRTLLSDFDFFKSNTRQDSRRSSSISIRAKKNNQAMNDSKYSFYGNGSPSNNFPNTA